MLPDASERRAAKQSMIHDQYYQILIEDCCVEATITAKFIGWLRISEDDSDGEIIHDCPKYEDCTEIVALFDIGRIGPLEGCWHPVSCK